MKDIIEKLIKFRDDRNWKQFHTPENLAKSIVLEAAELLENYQWQSKDVDLDNIKDEIADVVLYALLFVESYGFNLEDILNHKIEKNAKKYPVSKSYGKSDKYNKI
jgi:NTP pyrophosphatase (non-canonical NTP hydrolase)